MNATDIAATLRRQIVAARYVTNERLPPERVLAEQFGVARGTIREALRRLEQMGMVSRRAGSGTYVTHAEHTAERSIVETTRPLELVDARFALEPHMVRLAVLHATEQDVRRVEIHAETMENCGNDAAIFADADEAFHMALAACAQNPLIEWMMDRIQEVRNHSQWARMRTLTLTPDYIALYNAQHRVIIDAIRARDAEGAAQAMKTHLATARRSLVDVADQ